MLDLEPLVLAEAGQALRIERAPDLARPLLAVIGRDGAIEIAVADEFDAEIGVLLLLSHGDVEMLDVLRDVGDDLRQLRLAVGPAAVREHPHGHVVFSDAVDPARQMILGAEGGLQKSFDDFGVAETGLLPPLPPATARDFPP